ncbi:hypothetical protein HDU84_007194 [Entophlyctis sp. JEL0112]|nr:hypothetical protein HDU84_007194 [Entophlyctis sp. JEL0112]
MHPAVLSIALEWPAQTALPKPIMYRQAVLKDYARFSIKNLPYPAMIPCVSAEATQPGCTARNSSVKGVVCDPRHLAELVGITVDEVVERLDLFEGNQYRRILVEVEVDENGQMRRAPAHAYEWIVGTDELLLSAGDWSYVDFERRGGLARMLAEEMANERNS